MIKERIDSVIYKYLKKEVPTKWHRKEFKDFEYIKTQIK